MAASQLAAATNELAKQLPRSSLRSEQRTTQLTSMVKIAGIKNTATHGVPRVCDSPTQKNGLPSAIQHTVFALQLN